jgi:aryl-alcohol dehydrogenase-like predicted oxidoreductase
MHVKRRSFIGALGAAGLLAVRAPATAQNAPDGRMQMRAIPASGERLPVIGMGTSGTFDAGESPTERAPLVEVTRLLLQTPNSLIDTAPSYGRAEAVVGDILQGGGWRERAFVATKISARAGEDARAQWARSLARLRTDKVDLLQVHNLVDWQQNLAFLRELKAAGKVRYVGITHYVDSAHDTLAQIVQAEKLDFLQINYSVTSRSAERRLLPLCRDRGVAVLINRAFEDGRLFGTVKGRELPAWAGEIGCNSWAQLLLKFVLADPAVTVVIPATSKPKNMADNLAAGSGPMPDAKQRDRIAALFA